jgi:hypothetical protein
MRGEIAATLALSSRPCNGGVAEGPLPRHCDLARILLNDARLAFYRGGELPVQIHVHADTLNDWHPDLKPPAPTTISSEAPAWLYKIAIFLQDHPEQDGLSVVPGSHQQGNTARAPTHVRTRAGDIVVFDLRVQHAGVFPSRIERLIQNLALSLHRIRLVDDPGGQRLFRLFRRVKQLVQPTGAVKRLAIFLFYAPMSDVHREYEALRERYSENGCADSASSSLVARNALGARDALWCSYRKFGAVLRTIYYAIEGPPAAGS